MQAKKVKKVQNKLNNNNTIIEHLDESYEKSKA